MNGITLPGRVVCEQLGYGPSGKFILLILDMLNCSYRNASSQLSSTYIVTA